MLVGFRLNQKGRMGLQEARVEGVQRSRTPEGNFRRSKADLPPLSVSILLAFAG